MRFLKKVLTNHRGGSEPTKSHECLEQEVFQKVGKRYYEFPKICDLFLHVLLKNELDWLIRSLRVS